jgi:16S rRNA G966 N2-methylase RsmD
VAAFARQWREGQTEWVNSARKRTRSANNTKFHVVPPAATQGLVRSPMLSSQPILDAMFRRCVVLCEGDPDRAIYQTVAEKISGVHSSGEVLFVHTNGKGGMRAPLEHLRQAGTPIAAIADFDILNQATELQRIMYAMTGADLDPALEIERAWVAEIIEKEDETLLIQKLTDQVNLILTDPPVELRVMRKLLNAAADSASKWDAVKKHGVLFFELGDQPRVQALLANLAKLGLFVVPCGELESWIPDAGIKKGQKWNAKALQLLSDDKMPLDLKTFVKNVLSFLKM